MKRTAIALLVGAAFVLSVDVARADPIDFAPAVHYLIDGVAPEESFLLPEGGSLIDLSGVNYLVEIIGPPLGHSDGTPDGRINFSGAATLVLDFPIARIFDIGACGGFLDDRDSGRDTIELGCGGGFTMFFDHLPEGTVSGGNSVLPFNRTSSGDNTGGFLVGSDKGGSAQIYIALHRTASIRAVVPEPTALVLLGIGALGVLGNRWRQRKVYGVRRRIVGIGAGEGD